MDSGAPPPGSENAPAAPLGETPRGEQLAETAQIAESAEGDALVDGYQALPPGFAEEHGYKVERPGSGYAVMLRSVDEIFFNRVFGLGLVEPVTEKLIDDLMARYRSEGIRRFAIQLSPAATPANVGDWLTGRGFRLTDSWAKVQRGIAPPPEIPTSLRVREIGPEHAADFSRVVRSGFPEVPREFSPWLESLIGRPGWRHFMAFNGDDAVASGSLFVGGEVGWLSFGSTLPSYRRLGAQGALMVRRIQEGIAMGCRQLITEAEEDLPDRPNPSYHNMMRTGFQLAYLRANYIVEL